MTLPKRHYIAILLLGLPILAGQVGSIATGIVDNIMVGHYSTDALASAGFCNNVFNLALLALMGFSYGITPLVGARYGRGDRHGIGGIMRSAVWVNLGFLAVVTLIMSGLYVALPWLGQPPRLLPIIRPYFIICILGLIPVTVFNIFAQWSYGVTNTVVPMVAVLAGNALNVVGNYALIFGNFGCPELGLTGAGISTLIARILTAAIMLLWFLLASGHGPEYRRGYRMARITRQSVHKVWVTSIPVSMQMTFETAAFSGSVIMCGLLGVIPLAAFQIMISISTLGFCIYYAIGAAVAVRVANAGGCGQTGQMRRIAWAGYHITLVIMLAVSLLFWFGGPQIMGLFTEDQAVLACALSLIVPLLLYQLGDATQINFANALRGTGHVKPMLWIAFVAYLLLGLPSTWLLAFTAGLGVYGIVLSFSVSLFSAGAGFLYFFLRSTRTNA